MAALIIVIPVLAFTVYCVADVARATAVRSLSRGVWAVICLVSMPLGGILYLAAGKAWKVPEGPGAALRWPMWHGH
jgi:hypothetical protein